MKIKYYKKWIARRVVFIPIKINLELIIGDNTPFKWFKISKAEYIISLIFEIPANNKRINNEEGFTSINAKTLEKEIWDYKKYIDYLLKIEIIQTDNYYVNGLKSRCYRITEKYHSKVLPKVMLENLKQFDNIKFKGGKRKYAHLFKWFNEGLTIDYNAAMNFLEKEFEINTKNQSEKTREAIERFNRSLVNVFKINYGNYSVSIDSNIARLHSPLTNLRSDLRQFLRYNGEKLASVDIKNSQPYISARIFDLDFWRPSQQKYRWCEVEDKISSVDLEINKINIRVEDIEEYIMFGKSNENQYCIELEKYLKLLINGRLYEYFQPYLIAEIGDEYIDRQLVKKQILMCLYSDNIYFKQPKAATKRIFERHFPHVYKLLKIIKEQDKRHLSWILQRIESKVMLEIITKNLAKERPEMPLFTIHDSILTTVGNEDYVEGIMKSELTRLIGYEPSLKVDFENSEQPEKLTLNNTLWDTSPVDIVCRQRKWTV